MLAGPALRSGDAEARTHVDGGSRLSTVVAKALPAVVSITTRAIDRDQFNRTIGQGDRGGAPPPAGRTLR